ncbi:MAG: TrkA family potassium uptake protein [Spartobacteria bacterium]|nr:TrkA family potassium uptake protein [Spartobacteria bacterium]
MERVGIIGLGRFGQYLATELAERGNEIIAIDQDEAIVQQMSNSIGKLVIGDATQEETLKQAGFDSCDAVVITISESMENSMLATMALQEIGIPVIIARAFNEMHGKVLKKLGAHRIVYPALDSARRLAKIISNASFVEYMEVSDGVSLIEILAPKKWNGMTLAELQIATTYNVTILGIKRKQIKVLDEVDEKQTSEETIIPPSGTDSVYEDDTLIIFGKDDNIRQLQNDV